MRKSWLSAALAAGCLSGGGALASDHRDGPAVKMDGTTDIADVYAWMSADASKAYLVMTLAGGPVGASSTTAFSNTALYAFHTTSGSMFGDTSGSAQIICKFSADAAQQFQCWGPSGEYVTGAVGNATGVTSASGKFQVFAGVRADPFFFNLRGFKAVTTTVGSVAGTLKFDTAGCPTVDANTSALLVNTLKQDGKGNPGVDDFAKGGASTVTATSATTSTGNVLAIVVAVDKTLITTATAPVVSVWGSTNKAQ